MSSPYTAFQAPPQQQSQAPQNPYAEFQSAPQNDEPQGSSFMRFIKAAGSKLLGGTLNAGPTMQSEADPQKMKDMEEFDAQRMADIKAGKGAWSNAFPSPSWSGTGESAINTLQQINPVAVDKFQQGDIAGGAGDTLANLLLIRGGLKTRNLAEFGRSGAAEMAERVQPLSGYTKITPEQVAASRQPPSIWSGKTPPGYPELNVPQEPLSATPVQDALHKPSGVQVGEGIQGPMGMTRPISKDGKPLGSITYEVKGDTATVHHFGGPESDYNAFSNSLGRQGLRDVANQLQAAHPELQKIEGIRIGGAKGEEGRSVTIPINTAPRHVGPGPAQFQRWLAQKAAEQRK